MHERKRGGERERERERERESKFLKETFYKLRRDSQYKR
jgi:hypothetical protein